MFSIDDYNYSLPPELIAQVPVPQRDQSRLMVLERKHRRISHHRFADITRLLQPKDMLIVNNTRVVPGRLKGTKETGGSVEVLLLDYPQDMERSKGAGRHACQCLVKASKPPRPGSAMHFDEGLKATVLEGAEGIYTLDFEFQEDFGALLERIGQVPLPPYIKRQGPDSAPCDDRQCYQTVYAETNGAVAAPTAGLHFSRQLLKDLAGKRVEVIPITLHVGYATFLPVRVTDIRKHKMHPEAYELTDRAASAINQAKDSGRRIIAVGTTTVRVLEYASYTDGCLRPGSGKCDLFIYPGFEFRVIDAMITNFHLPKSTLLMLVSAFSSRQFILDAYQEAVRQKYRFYSYGDAMLIL
jgi:S-adenosylmethionine:tRNA ribosyltransferase-isomerase